jgi:hypothetical protein
VSTACEFVCTSLEAITPAAGGEHLADYEENKKNLREWPAHLEMDKRLQKRFRV